jgi:hypothetical protein
MEQFNYLSNNGFKLIIDNKEWADIEYQVTETALPGISFGESPTPYKNYEGYVPGDTIIYEPLTVTFVVDENLISYRKIVDWIIDLRENHVNAVHDLELFIYTNHNNANQRIRFVNGFPTSLSEITFNSTNSDIEYSVASMSIRYDYYEFVDKFDASKITTTNT